MALALAAAHSESEVARRELTKADDVSPRLEEVAQVPAILNIEQAWAAVTKVEQRIFIEELEENVTVPPDHFGGHLSGPPRLHVRYQEVGAWECPDWCRRGDLHKLRLARKSLVGDLIRKRRLGLRDDTALRGGRLGSLPHSECDVSCESR